MLEILWNTDAPPSSLEDQDFYELIMADLTDAGSPRFLVREIHAAWSPMDQQISWDGCVDEICLTAELAQRSIRNRRAAIVRRGFSYPYVLYGG